MPDSWKKTYIVPIPKKLYPSHVTDYQPINLDNTMYKIVGKVLANRLKLILPNLISEEQRAFVYGRSVTNNFLAP